MSDEPAALAYNAADNVVAMARDQPPRGDVIAAAIEVALARPAQRRDLYDVIHAQDETNFRILAALAAMASKDEQQVQHHLQRVVDGVRYQSELTRRLSGYLLQLGDPDGS